jgi:hypothetical protein
VKTVMNLLDPLDAAGSSLSNLATVNFSRRTQEHGVM